MINLNFEQTETSTEKMFQENIIDDALKVADIDRSEVKDEWNNADTVIGKLSSVNDTTIKKVANRSEEIDKSLDSHRIDNRSIIARAKNSVLQFPVYVMQTLRVNEAQIISGLFERVYTTLVQTVLSQNPFLTEEEANNLVFLKKFHTNLKESVNVITDNYHDAIDDVDQMIHDAVFHSQRLSENCIVEFRSVPTEDKLLILENKRLMNEPLTGFSFLKEAQETTTSTHKDEEKVTSQRFVSLSDDDFNKMAAAELDLSQKDIDLIKKSDVDIARDLSNKLDSSKPEKPKESNYNNNDDYDKAKEKYEKDLASWSDNLKDKIEDDKEKRDDLKDKLDSKIDEMKSDIKNGKYKKYRYNKGRFMFIDDSGTGKTKTTTVTQTRPKELKPDPVNQAVDAPRILKESDIKKINAMLPYTVEVTFRIKSNDGGVARDMRYIIGIKCVMHIIRPQDIADDLKELVTGNIKSLQKVRYKTGEISFKDYFFNLKNIKADAAKRINYNKRWVNTLKRLSEYNKLYGSLFNKPIKKLTNGSIPIPNATLILTQPDIVTLTNQTGIDLSSVSNAKRLAKNLFLIAVVIVDSSAGSMRVLFPDSSNDWDVYSLAAIDAELTKTDNSNFMKELNKLVNK